MKQEAKEGKCHYYPLLAKQYEMTIDQNEFSRQATIRICGSLDIETALAQCCDYLKAFLPISGLILMLYEPVQGLARMVASLVSDDLQPLKPTHAFPEQLREQIAVRWLAIKEIEIINDPAADSVVRQSYSQVGWSLDASIIAMRLELEGQRVGVLTVTAKGINRYTSDHARLLLLLHEPFAIASAPDNFGKTSGFASTSFQ